MDSVTPVTSGSYAHETSFPIERLYPPAVPGFSYYEAPPEPNDGMFDEADREQQIPENEGGIIECIVLKEDATGLHVVAAHRRVRMIFANGSYQVRGTGDFIYRADMPDGRTMHYQTKFVRLLSTWLFSRAAEQLGVC
jgi:hypothetical protein